MSYDRQYYEDQEQLTFRRAEDSFGWKPKVNVVSADPLVGGRGEVVDSVILDGTVIKLVEQRPDSNPKSAFGMKKPPLHLIPKTAMIILSKVMALGAKKYSPFNWRENSVAASVYVSAAERHLASWFDGESIDPESGVSHLGHAMACLAIILDAEATGNLIDDRPKAGATARLIRELTDSE